MAAPLVELTDRFADLRDLPGVTFYAPGEETVVIDGETVDLHFGW